ncbi:MAG: hypothetical protein KC466_11040 [Myxococcales bacterium]|nr:hypothetical protein [Myxococcales bacterium]
MLALLVALARGGARARALLLTIGLVHLGSAIATRTSYGQSPQWRASYDRLFAPALALGLASLWPRRREDELARAAEGDPPANDMSKGTSKAPAGAALVITGDAPARARVWLVVAGSSALLTALHGRATLGSTTEQLEHHAVRRALAAFPEPCALAYVNAVGDGRVLTLPDLGLVGAGAHLVVTAPDGELPTPVPTIGGCLLYAHVSLCASAEGRPACTRVEQQLPLGEPLMMTTLPARQSHVSFPYDQDVVDVALYRVALEGAGSR